jgi:transcriptional regulator of arginine metabolism
MGKGVRRRELIAAALSRGLATSQAGLCAMLHEHGITATQATVSRDLRELGAVKTADGYRLIASEANGVAVPTGASDKSMRQTLETFLVGADVACNLVVLKTGPGQAQVVALEFDRKSQPEVVGVIAGDDTIFLATGSEDEALALCDRVRELAGLGEIGEGK